MQLTDTGNKGDRGKGTVRGSKVWESGELKDSHTGEPPTVPTTIEGEATVTDEDEELRMTGEIGDRSGMAGVVNGDGKKLGEGQTARLRQREDKLGPG